MTDGICEDNMKKKFMYIWGEFKHSWIFNTLVIVETVICIILLSICLHAAEINKVNSAFYNGTVAKTSYVSFGSNGMTVGELKARLGNDLSDMATATDIENFPYPMLTIVTPSVVDKMPNLGIKFSKDLPADYREAYVSEIYKSDYKKGDIYDIPIDDDKSVRIKILGHFDEMSNYYRFTEFAVTAPTNGIIVCDNLSDDMTVYNSFFFNGESPAIYKDMGFSAKLGKDLYNENTTNRILDYLSIIILLVMITSIFCNYMLNLDKLKKRYAIQHVSGIDHRTIIVSEVIKMAIMFLVAVMIALFVTIGVVELDTSDNGTMSYVSYIYSILIVLGLYGVTVSCGLFGLVHIKPLSAIKDETNE